MFSVPANFIGDFKTGDNINYNLQILSTLYDCCEHEECNKNYLIKPIILTIMSVVEAVLCDFDSRIRWFTREGVSNIPADVLGMVRSKNYDQLEKYIACAKKHDFFDSAYSQIYDDLNKLREVRNRIHIQNKKNYTPRVEQLAFQENNKVLAENVLEVVLRTMDKKYTRPPSVQGCVSDFSIPWSARHENITSGNSNAQTV